MPEVVIGNAGNVFNMGSVGTINDKHEGEDETKATESSKVDEAQEILDSAQIENPNQALLMQARDVAKPKMRELLAEILNLNIILNVEPVGQSDFIHEQRAIISKALTDFCTEALTNRSWLHGEALAKLTAKDVKGATKQSLNTMIATADAVELVKQVVEALVIPNRNLVFINEKLTLIEKKAAELDDPRTIERRKLARRLLIAGIALAALALAATVASVLVLTMVAAPLALPLFIGLVVTACAMSVGMSVTAGISTKMTKQFSYQPTALSHTLHFFRDTVKDTLAGKQSPGECNQIYQICRNAR